MLKIFKFIGFILFSFVIIGCVPRDVNMPNNNISHNGNFINSNVNVNDWATQTNVEEEENIDISDIDQELSETDMTTLENSSQKVERIPFPAKEYARLPRSGKGTIEGDVYLVDVYEDKVYGKNTRLYLNPITSYSNQWYKEKRVI